MLTDQPWSKPIAMSQPNLVRYMKRHPLLEYLRIEQRESLESNMGSPVD